MDFSGVTRRGPCGACKFMRKKCVKECIFAPYFDSSVQGASHFAAVHKVFGASNASKVLMCVPPHKRLDAVFSLCYEAFARVRDPVHGCVGHILALQQQVVNLQAELAYVRARLSTMHQTCSPPSLNSSSSDHHLASNNDLQSGYAFMNLDHPLQNLPTSLESTSFFCPSSSQQLDDHQPITNFKLGKGS